MFGSRRGHSPILPSLAGLVLASLLLFYGAACILDIQPPEVLQGPQVGRGGEEPGLTPTPGRTGRRRARLTPTPAPTVRPWQRTVVKITASDGKFRYTVDGLPQVIQGVAYNASYEGRPSEEKARAYDEDFRRMQEAGVNTIVGVGDNQEFDLLTLDKAAQYGLGVALPYYLGPHADYGSAAYQAEVRGDVISWVNRYKDHPALRMWAVGSEVVPALDARQARTFAKFYVALADMIHQLDPDHPVLYRGSEEYDVESFVQVLKESDQPRPWLVYGLDVFTLRLGQTLQDWDRTGWPGPVVVSAFGPLGLYPADRPVGYLRMWRSIRKHSHLVLGGFAYVWTTAGAHPMDQAFGLFEDDGSPADASFDTLATVFRGHDLQIDTRRGPLPGGGAPAPPELPFSLDVLLPPSKVVVSGSQYNFTLQVNGRPETIKGIGYNTMYQGLPVEQRAVRYDEDFTAIRDMGANMIIGWGEQRQFDELTLIKAQQHGIGVIFPYYLDPMGDYNDPEYRELVRQDVAAWVARFRGFPALRIWGLGNEVIHLLGTEDAQVFAEFYVELADMVHALDPDHPVAYRAAEDVGIEPLILAFQRDGQPRPWFVLGMNIFTFRIEQAIKEWPDWNWDIGLFFSEFGPLGLPPEERPDAFRRMWQAIEEGQGTVLGGIVYVWTTDGPERVDVAFGLVDGAGQKVDDLYDAVSRAYRGK